MKIKYLLSFMLMIVIFINITIFAKADYNGTGGGASLSGASGNSWIN